MVNVWADPVAILCGAISWFGWIEGESGRVLFGVKHEVELFVGHYPFALVARRTAEDDV